MASAAFVTEFRSFMTYECETSSTQFSNLKHFNNADHRMAPQEIPVLIDDKNLINESQSLRNRESPISSPGTSGESSSSPPAQPSEEMTDINPMMEHHSSSEDSDCPDECPDHLKQMEGVLEKNGILAQNLSCSYGANDVEMEDDSLLGTHETYDLNDSRSTIPVCHFCQFSAETREEYNRHIHSHFQFKCTQCSYMARTKGRLENHMKNHREAHENRHSGRNGRANTENGNRSPGENVSRNNKKDRTTRCKTCDFVGKNKSEYYAHLRKKVCFTGPLLECEFEQCEFCTRYKHHFEYHLRNHFGSKPFKCDQCNYVCVNQSMLNSHMKSHSSQYPYRCKTCTYATKYLHSLKMHVKKYDHEPDKVLNPDGSVNPNLIIDVNGRRRGPKSKKAKNSNSTANHRASTSIAPPRATIPSPPSVNYHQNPTLPSLNPSLMYNNPMFNNVAGNGFFQPPIFDPSMGFVFPPFWNMGNLRCNYPQCDYAADSTESMQQHLVAHINSRQYEYEKYGRNPNAFSRERHLTPEAIQELESRFQSFAENTPRMQAVENISRTQADNQFRLRMREHAEANRISFKLPEVSMAEYGSRRGFSPPLNNGDIPLLSFAGRHTENSKSPAQKDFLENREGFNMVRSSSISPPSMEQARGSSSRSSSSCEGVDNCSFPLDLTSNISIIKPKVCNPLGTTTPQQEKKRENAEPVSIQPQRTTKNRRKGKAFKIDQYLQYEDQSTELSNPSFDMISHIQNDKVHETHVKMEVEDLSSFPPNVNGKLQKLNIGKPECYSKVPEKSTTPIRMESSPKTSFQISPKHFSTPKAPSPVAVNGHLYRNGHHAEVSQGTASCSYINGYRSSISETNIPTNLRNGHVTRNGDKSGVLKEATTISNGVSLLDSSKETNANDQQELGDKHKCPHCDIGFGDFVMLVMHMTCHSMGNPFLCAKCGADCKNRIGFMDHMINYCKRR